MPGHAVGRFHGTLGKTVAVIAAAGALGSAAACSSSGAAGNGASASNAGAQSSTRQACVAKANAFLAKYDKLPTTLGPAYTKLSHKPAPNQLFIKLVNGAIPSDNDAYVAEQQAVKVIGWRAEKIVHQGTVEDVNTKLEQAISQHPAIIGIAGWPVEAISKSLADAKKAGIIVSMSSVPDTPTGYPGFAAVQNGSTSNVLRGRINANLFMRASNCAGHVAIFSLPFPILKVSTDAFAKEVKQNCPDCQVSYNEVQTSDLGTPAATSAIVSKLQSDPSVKWVYSIIANLASGLDVALNQAGITGVNIFGQTPDANSVKALRDKTNAWWIGLSPQMTGWTELSLGLQAMDAHKAVTDLGRLPQAILTQNNVGDATDVPSYPVDYQKQFAALWQAGRG